MKNNIEELYYEYRIELFNFIRNKVPDRFMAEDILHDVFIKVLHNITKLKDERKVKSWLYQITRNSIIDFYRTENDIRGNIVEIMIVENPKEEESYERLRLSVLEMIEQLPFKYRQAIFLADYKGLRQKEISQKLKVTHTCVKSRVQRARRMMKQIYLDCCHFEFDRNGKVIDYYNR